MIVVQIGSVKYWLSQWCACLDVVEWQQWKGCLRLEVFKELHQKMCSTETLLLRLYTMNSRMQMRQTYLKKKIKERKSYSKGRRQGDTYVFDHRPLTDPLYLVVTSI
ncbi:uncharacterized protein LOC122023288 [Zingiber officinale]|uniref:uncharacterized protein LOC122023288 n=1 Tax=Zingiber officinale TaxID=94328 RepID=UPI001C4D41D9|nr:uncharacterized protein LOC122023288 [Zingiber officinale]XP_042437290.1 uncharacterized protein LOC122023288 [Zingiber officinale]